MQLIKKRPGTLWQAIIVFLILLDAILLFLSIISNLNQTSIYNIALFDLVVSFVLLIGYLWVLNRTKEKLSYIKKSWLLFIAFIPIYFIAISTGLSDAIFIIKILNLIKIFALYLFAQRLAKEVIKYQEKTRLVYALAIFLLVFFICSFIFYVVEHPVNPEVGNYEDSLWFVLQTITTVGYGDINPVTGIGRLMGVIAMFSALALTSIITSAATFSLIEKFREGTEHLTKSTKERVEALDKKLDNINMRFDELNLSEDIIELKDDIKDIKSEINNLKEIIRDKK